jgi:hypothetical protein
MHRNARAVEVARLMKVFLLEGEGSSGPSAGRVAKLQLSTLHIGQLLGISATKAQKVLFFPSRASGKTGSQPALL